VVGQAEANLTGKLLRHKAAVLATTPIFAGIKEISA